MKNILTVLAFFICFSCRLEELTHIEKKYDYAIEFKNNTGVDIEIQAFLGGQKLDSIFIKKGDNYKKKLTYSTYERGAPNASTKQYPFIWNKNFSPNERDSIVTIYDKKKYSYTPYRKKDGSFNEIYKYPAAYTAFKEADKNNIRYYNTFSNSLKLGTYTFCWTKEDYQNAKDL